MGLGQFVEEIGWADGKGRNGNGDGNGGIGGTQGDSDTSLSLWEATLTELVAYGAASDVYDSEEEG
jgi:hypothetical protein